MTRAIIITLLAIVAFLGGGVALVIGGFGLLFQDAPNPAPAMVYLPYAFLAAGIFCVMAGGTSIQWIIADKRPRATWWLALAGSVTGAAIIVIVVKLFKSA